MPNRAPIVANPAGIGTFQELILGDNLDLSTSAIINCSGIGVTFINVTGVSTLPHCFVNGQLNNVGLTTIPAPLFHTGQVIFNNQTNFSTTGGFGNISVGGTFNSLGISTVKTYRAANYAEEILYSTATTLNVTHIDGFGNLIYNSSPSGNVTFNLTVPTTDPLFYGRSLFYVFVFNQGGTPYIINTININGTSKTINWVDGSAPSAHASKKDLFTFHFINTNESSSNATDYIVLGNLINYGFGTL